MNYWYNNIYLHRAELEVGGADRHLTMRLVYIKFRFSTEYI